MEATAVTAAMAGRANQSPTFPTCRNCLRGLLQVLPSLPVKAGDDRAGRDLPDPVADLRAQGLAEAMTAVPLGRPATVNRRARVEVISVFIEMGNGLRT